MAPPPSGKSELKTDNATGPDQFNALKVEHASETPDLAPNHRSSQRVCSNYSNITFHGEGNQYNGAFTASINNLTNTNYLIVVPPDQRSSPGSSATRYRGHARRRGPRNFRRPAQASALQAVPPAYLSGQRSGETGSQALLLQNNVLASNCCHGGLMASPLQDTRSQGHHVRCPQWVIQDDHMGPVYCSTTAPWHACFHMWPGTELDYGQGTIFRGELMLPCSRSFCGMLSACCSRARCPASDGATGFAFYGGTANLRICNTSSGALAWA